MILDLIFRKEKEMVCIDKNIIYLVEEALNNVGGDKKRTEEQIFKNLQKNNYDWNRYEKKYEKLQEIIDQMVPDKTFFDVLDDWLLKKGYGKSNGSIDYASFYKYARITKTTWSNLRIWSADATGNVPKKETLLKIVIGLHLKPQEADQLMKKASNGLNYNDLRDRVIMACMYKNIYEPEDVYEILEYFATADGKMRRFKNIYGDPDMDTQ